MMCEKCEKLEAEVVEVTNQLADAVIELKKLERQANEREEYIQRLENDTKLRDRLHCQHLVEKQGAADLFRMSVCLTPECIGQISPAMLAAYMDNALYNINKELTRKVESQIVPKVQELGRLVAGGYVEIEFRVNIEYRAIPKED